MGIVDHGLTGCRSCENPQFGGTESTPNMDTSIATFLNKIAYAAAEVEV